MMMRYHPREYFPRTPHPTVQKGLLYGMILFIIYEVLFFTGFFRRKTVENRRKIYKISGKKGKIPLVEKQKA